MHLRAAMVAIAFLTILSSVAPAQEKVDFATEILPILQRNCVACHNLKFPEAGLNLENYEVAMKGGDAGAMVKAGDADHSLLVGRITGEEDSIMPPEDNTVGAKPLTAEEIGLVKRWINEGATGGSSSMAKRIQWSPVPPGLKPIYALHTTSDGQWMAVGRANRASVYRWPGLLGGADRFELIDPQVQTHNRASDAASHLDMVHSIVFSPDGQRLVTGGYRELKMWGRQRQSLPIDAFSFATSARRVAASPDGAWIAVETAQHQIEIWHQDGSKKVLELQGHVQDLVSLQWSSNSQRIVSCDKAGLVALWQVTSAATNPTKLANALAQQQLPGVQWGCWVGTDSVAFQTAEKRVQLWKLQTPTAENAPTFVQLPWGNEIAQVESIVGIATDPARLIVGQSDGNIQAFQMSDGKLLATLVHGAAVRWLLVSPDQTRLASLGVNGSLRIWNTVDGQMLMEIQGDHRSKTQLGLAQGAVARQNAMIERLNAVAAELEKNKQAEIDARAKQKVERDKAAEAVAAKVAEFATVAQTYQQAEAGVQAAQQAMAEATKKLEEANKVLLAAGEARKKAEAAKAEVESTLAKHDQTLVASDEAIDRATKAIPIHQSLVETEKTLLVQLQQQFAALQSATSTVSACLATCFSPDGKSIVTSHEDRTLRVSRIDKGVPAEVLNTDVPVNSIAWTSNHRLLSASWEGPLQWREIGNQWYLERTIGSTESSPITDRVTSLDISPDGKLVAVGSGPPSRFGDVKIFSMEDGRLVKDLGELHSDSVQALKFAPNGKELASAGADKVIRVTKLSESWPYRTLEGHTHHVLGLAWQDQGQILASASADNTVKIWDVANGQQLRTLAGFGREITAIAFVGATRQLASSSADKQVRTHDIDNGNAIRGFGGALDALYTISVADEGKWVAAGGQDGIVWIWQVDNAQVLQKIEQ